MPMGLWCLLVRQCLWFTSIYGPCEREVREASFKELVDLKKVIQGPWLLGEDFNMIFMEFINDQGCDE